MASDGFGLSDIVALVGAAAWLPHVARYFSKPKVTIIVGNSIEIGFTGLGPLFNPTLAFRTEKRDALITGVMFTVTHENGQVSRFRSMQLAETPAFSHSSSGESAAFQKTQSAVAAVVTPTTIAELKINCRERRHLQQYAEKMAGFQSGVRRLQGGFQEAGWIDTVRQSPECESLRTFLKSSFVWQPGKYEVRAAANIAEIKEPIVKDFAFSLTESQIAALRGNIALLEREFSRIAWDEIDTTQPQNLPWHWAYPATWIDVQGVGDVDPPGYRL